MTTEHTEKNLNIAIADDHPLILKGLQNMLQTVPGIRITQTYNDGESLLAGLAEYQPDILLLDIQMPGLSGDVLTRMIVRQYPNVKIIALTNLDSAYFIKTMFQAGALGYILKTASEETILEAIRVVNNNGQFLEKKLQESVLQATLSGAPAAGKSPVLTNREIEVLQMIAENLTSKEIAERLFLSKRTIDHHRNNLLLKLDVKNTASLIKKAISLDLIR